MGKRNAVKRLKSAQDVRASSWNNEPVRGRGAHLQMIEGGRGWHPDDSDEIRNEIPHERTQRYQKTIKPRSENQAQLMNAMDSHALVCALGPAGTGKTYLAIVKAVEALQKGKVSKIILSRPAVEAGEQLGFLPGGMEDKLAPYLRPLYDALADRLSPAQLKHMLAEGIIEIAPFVVIDEAQNCTYTQLKMLLTRLGWHSTMVITGDPGQTDLSPEFSGLAKAAERLEKLSGAAVIKLEGADVVRHPLVAEMLDVL